MTWWDSGDDDDEQYDESRIRVRPNPKSNRPRSKRRPAHKDASTARVLSVDRGRYRVLLVRESHESGLPPRTLTCTRARELRNVAIVTGDRVDIVGNLTGDEGSLARIVRIGERSTLLRRSADDTDEVERVIVANADQMLIVVAAAHPEPRARLVDRYLVAAYDAGISPILCITKTDLADPSEFLANFDGLDIPVLTSSIGAFPVAEVTQKLIGHETVFVGHSGVGKSTLVNAIVPEAHRTTGHVNAVTGRGRHTSSSTVSYRVELAGEEGWVIDTPGVRSFGLGHVNTDNILHSFTDLYALSGDCPRGCPHLPDEPECAISLAVSDGALGTYGARRLDSLQRLLATFRS